MTDVNIGGNLTVAKDTTLNGKITCRADGFYHGFLRVGALAAVGYNVLAIAFVQQDFGVGGDTVLTGNLTVNGGDGVLVEGPVIINDILRTNPPHGIVCGGVLAVADNATFQQDIIIQGALTVNGTAASLVKGPLTVNNVLQTNGVNGNIVCGGTLTSIGTATFQKDAVITRHLIAAGGLPRVIQSSFAAGTFSVTVDASSHDLAGSFTITQNDNTANHAIAANDFVQIGYSVPFANKASSVILTLGPTAPYGPLNWGNASVFVAAQTENWFFMKFLQPSALFSATNSATIYWMVVGV